MKSDKNKNKALALKHEQETGHKTRKHFLNHLAEEEAKKELKDELRRLRLRDNDEEQGQPLHEKQPIVPSRTKG